MTRAALSFLRQHARTRGFTLGEPHGFTVSRDGERVAFLRSRRGDDPIDCLWVLDLHDGCERLIVDPLQLGVAGVGSTERGWLDRTREGAAGIVGYAANTELRVAAFTVAGRLFMVDLACGQSRWVPVPGPASDPRPDPMGGLVAYTCGRGLRVVDGAGRERLRVEEPSPEVSWGVPEFVAATEIGRTRGHWWAPSGAGILAARVDTTAAPRYPLPGGNHAGVTLGWHGLDGTYRDIAWDGCAFPYLVSVRWQPGELLTLLVQSRDQRVTRVLLADPTTTATTTTMREDVDPAWIQIVPGVPAWLADGRLVVTATADDTRRLVVGDELVTPPGLQVHQVVHAHRSVVLTASDEPSEAHVWQWSPTVGLTRLTRSSGVHHAWAGGNTVVIASSSLEEDGTSVSVLRDGRVAAEVQCGAERPVVRARPQLLRAGSRQLRAALLLPRDGTHEGSLPVLLDPYGGPQFQKVLCSRRRYLFAQWFADRGFAVLVTDGRGTPGRGPGWERDVLGDLAGAPLQDQVDALHWASERYCELDLDRVAIRGWSFGGFLAAFAVLRRPDVFHAAVAVAPVTDWRLYCSYYSERYLGALPGQSDAYARSSLLAEAAALRRPLLLIHGLEDDNVAVAHTLRLSEALTKAARPHSVLLLGGVDHAGAHGPIAEKLPLVELGFLRAALADTSRIDDLPIDALRAILRQAQLTDKPAGLL